MIRFQFRLLIRFHCTMRLAESMGFVALSFATNGLRQLTANPTMGFPPNIGTTRKGARASFGRKGAAPSGNRSLLNRYN
jgi:hypothetical protein